MGNLPEIKNLVSCILYLVYDINAKNALQKLKLISTPPFAKMQQ